MNYVSRAAQAKLLGLYPELEFEVNGDDVVLKNYKGVFKNYTVPDFITIIADGCFVDCPSLESIVIPKSVKKIGNCFHQCSNLMTIDIPDELTDIHNFVSATIAVNKYIKLFKNDLNAMILLIIVLKEQHNKLNKNDLTDKMLLIMEFIEQRKHNNGVSPAAGTQ